jgi:hypothetical protein
VTASTRPVPPETGTTFANADEPGSEIENLYTGPLLVLFDDRARIDRILNRLDVTDDLTERADLASELVRAASRHEDVVERAVLPALKARTNDSLLQRLATQRDELRQAMDYIHHRTQHLAPRNAHAGDAQGLEDAIDDVADRLTILLKDEDAQVIGLVRDLDPPAKLALEKAVQKALRHAAERPKPARTPIGRIASNIATKLDHVFEDASPPSHPGAETIDG